MSKQKSSSLKDFFIRLLILLVGLTIAHLGVTLFLLTELGSDPYNVLIQGLFRTFKVLVPISLTHGTTHVIFSFILIAVLILADKHYIKTGTLVCMFFGGPIIDLFSTLLGPLHMSEAFFPLRIAILSLGCVILAFGMTIVINSEAGTGPNDLVAIAISDKTGKPFSIIRILVDTGFVLSGFLLGGVFGIGTLVCVLLVGPVAGYFLPITKKMIRKLTSGSNLTSSQVL